MKYPINVRRIALANHILAQVDDFEQRDRVEWLIDFEGIPNDEAGLEKVEREEFISHERNDEDTADEFVVYVDNRYVFDTEDQAYEFFCTMYTRILKNEGVIS